jgi:hypothetical protein
VLVLELQVKVPQQPQERRREPPQLALAALAARTAAALAAGPAAVALAAVAAAAAAAAAAVATAAGGPAADAYVARHLDDESEAVERGLVDAAHLVVNEQAAEQHGEAEHLCAVLRRLRG